MSANYVPSFLLTPAQLCLALINHDNNKGYELHELNFKAPVALTDDPTGKNTSIETDLLVDPSEVEGDFVSFTYDRMGLGEVFSAIVTAGLNNFREVEVKENGQLVVAKVISEVARKYSVAINAEDFEITLPTASSVKVKAKAGNLAYIGEVDFTIDSSLASRIAIADMDEFATVAVAPVFTVLDVKRVAKTVGAFSSALVATVRADTNMTAVSFKYDANAESATAPQTVAMGDEFTLELGCDDTAEVVWAIEADNGVSTVSKNGTIEAVVA